MMRLTHLDSSLSGRDYAADELHILCPDCQRPLLARYDLAATRAARGRGDAGTPCLKGSPPRHSKY